jgi:hypothetical protein
VNVRARLVRVPDRVVLAGFCVVFSLLALSSVAQDSATFDEPSNLGSGYLELTRGNYWLKPETLPLIKMLAAAPLLVRPPRLPPIDWRDRWRFYDHFVYDGNGGDTLLMVARAAVLPLSLLLGGVVFVWTRRLFGRGAALFALFLYCFEPNLLAHAPLVATDLAVACFVFLALYGLFLLVERASVSRLLLMALAFALAVVTKLSTAPMILVVALLGCVVSLSKAVIPVRLAGRVVGTLANRRQKLLGLGAALLVTALVTWIVIWATYRFSYSAADSIGMPQPVEWAWMASEGTPVWRVLTWFREVKVLPEPYVYNFFFHLRIKSLIPGFLLGEVRQGGWWYYFVVTFLVKTPIPLLILAALALAVHARRWRTTALTSAFLAVPAAVYFVFISASGINMGHRHVLAVLPFLMVLTGTLVPWAAERRAWVRVGLVALSLWYVGSSCSVFPHYLAYFNEFAGGPSRGYRYLVDSNLDWGQDLKGLKRYMDRHGIERVWLSYFGMANPDYYGIRHELLPGSTIVDPKRQRPDLVALERLPRLPGVVAISATNLQGVYLPLFFGLNRGYFATYRDMTPIAQIGHSIFLYRVQ